MWYVDGVVRVSCRRWGCRGVCSLLPLLVFVVDVCGATGVTLSLFVVVVDVGGGDRLMVLVGVLMPLFVVLVVCVV